MNGDYRLQRLSAQIDAYNQEGEIKYQIADIDTMDSYEKCVKKLKDQTIEATRSTERPPREVVKGSIYLAEGPFVN